MLRRLTPLLIAAALAGCMPHTPPPTAALIGDPGRGAQLVTLYGCGSCHDIPGIAGAHGMAGPPLAHMAGRTIIAGYLPNTPANMVRWLQAPQSVAPGNAMPNLGLDDRDAKDMAAYLDTLR